MIRKKNIVGAISILLLTSSLGYCDADENYVIMHGAINRSFVETITKGRSHVGDKTADYLEVNGNEEFQEALESGKLNSDDLEDSSRIRKKYVYKRIKGVDIDERDLRDMEGDSLTIGSQVDGGNIVQSLDIEDSKINTDRELNVGVVSTDPSSAEDITSISNIRNSNLSGRKDTDDSKISTSKYFD